MISAKDSLQALCNFLSTYGCDDYQAELFRKAKLNQLPKPNPLKQIILFLILKSYHLSPSLQISSLRGITDAQLSKLITFYLHSIQAPFFTYIEEQELIDLGSSRNLLLILGWLFTIDNQYDKIDSNILENITNIDFFKPDTSEASEPPSPEDNFTDIGKKFSLVQKTAIFTDQKDEILYYMNEIRVKKNRIKKYQELRAKKLKIVQEKIGKSYTLKDILLICNKAKLDSLIESKSEHVTKIKSLESKITSRELLFEWLEDGVTKDKESIPQYGSYTDIDDAEVSEGMLDEFLHIKKIKISELVKTIDRQIEEFTEHKVVVKKFLEFWEGISSGLRQNKIFLDIIKEIVKSKNPELIKGNFGPEHIDGIFARENGQGVLLVDFFDWLIFDNEEGKKGALAGEGAKGKARVGLEKEA